MGMLLNIFLFALAYTQCHAAVTWQTVGCDGFNFQGTSIDDIWDNAVELATNAQSRINDIPKTPSIRTTKKTAGANAKFMFNITYGPSGMASSGVPTMNTAKSVFQDIQGALQGTLSGLPAERILFCGGNGLTHATNANPMPITGFTSGWYAPITINGQQDYIVLQYTMNQPDWPQPCTEETNAMAYQGKTFTVLNKNAQSFTGIILCPDQYARFGNSIRPTLQKNFDTTAPARIDSYSSVSGGLLHEMAHVYARVVKQIQWGDSAGGFADCVSLDTAAALINPDNYRIFAEMSMSPRTEWRAPEPKAI